MYNRDQQIATAAELCITHGHSPDEDLVHQRLDEVETLSLGHDRRQRVRGLLLQLLSDSRRNGGAN
jgi:hypothetical protein